MGSKARQLMQLWRSVEEDRTRRQFSQPKGVFFAPDRQVWHWLGGPVEAEKYALF